MNKRKANPNEPTKIRTIKSTIYANIRQIEPTAVNSIIFTLLQAKMIAIFKKLNGLPSPLFPFLACDFGSRERKLCDNPKSKIRNPKSPGVPCHFTKPSS
jgi:hypothetical protein